MRNNLVNASAVLLGCLISIFSGHVCAQETNSVQAIASVGKSGAEAFRFDFSNPIQTPPAGFVIQSPARVAIDLPGVANGLGRSSQEFSGGNVRSVNVVQASEKTRLVFNLKQPAGYRTEIVGKSLLVFFDGIESTPKESSARSIFSESGHEEIIPLKDVDFRRGDEDAGRVMVTLLNKQTGVDLKVQGKSLIIEFMRTSLPEGLRRKIDVADFGTPIQTILASQVNDRVRLVVEPKGDWEHSAYQSDDQFVLEVRAKKVDPNKLTQGTGFSGEKLSLNFQSIDVRSLLQVIADFTNFNIVTSDTVNGALTLRLKDVPWDQALQIILDSKGLGMKKSGNVLWIAPRDEIDARTKKDLEASQAIERLEPLRTQAFQLNYARAGDMVIQLRGGAGVGGGISAKFLSDRGSAIAEPRTNQLFVTDTPRKIVEVQALLAKLDIPVRQVLIEARIVEASDTFGRSLGARLGGSDLRGVRGGDAGYSVGNGNRVALGGSYNAVSSTTGESANSMDTSNTSFVNLPAVGQGGYSAAAFAVSIFNSAANRFLNLEISALEADGKGKIVSSPRVVTADQTKALIEQGTEFPYQQATSSGATSVAFRKANLKLEVIPQITPEGNIILDLDINKDSRGETTSSGIAINTKHIKTQVLVENGGTVVIGGIFELTETENEAKVPLLGDIPAVGNLFKSRARTSNKQEMLVFITPKMISDRGAAR